MGVVSFAPHLHERRKQRRALRELRAELRQAVAKGETERARELTRRVVECEPLVHSSRKWK